MYIKINKPRQERPKTVKLKDGDMKTTYNIDNTTKNIKMLEITAVDLATKLQTTFLLIAVGKDMFKETG